jgi:hypothetical protein
MAKRRIYREKVNGIEVTEVDIPGRRICIETTRGDILNIQFLNSGDGIEIRMDRKSHTGPMEINPRYSNVIEIR